MHSKMSILPLVRSFFQSILMCPTNANSRQSIRKFLKSVTAKTRRANGAGPYHIAVVMERAGNVKCRAFPFDSKSTSASPSWLFSNCTT
jgi:hypothetical protein